MTTSLSSYPIYPMGRKMAPDILEEEGRTEGYLSAQRACAKKLLALGMNPEAVREATTLPLIEIEELKNEILVTT